MDEKRQNKINLQRGVSEPESDLVNLVEKIGSLERKAMMSGFIELGYKLTKLLKSINSQSEISMKVFRSAVKKYESYLEAYESLSLLKIRKNDTERNLNNIGNHTR